MALSFFGFGRAANTFTHGVHPPERKGFSSGRPIEVLPTPQKVLLPMMQNLGAPCEPVVKAKQAVAYGEMIAKGKGFVSAPVFAPIAGKVQKATVCTLPNGRHVQAVPIKAEGEQLEGQALFDEMFGGDWPKDVGAYEPKAILDAIFNGGIVGLGGATFPAHVKLTPNEKKPVDTLIINGCECEPYLTSDYRLMLEAPGPIITGALLAARASGASRIIVGIEDNKPDAVEAIQKAAGGTKIEVAVLPTKYPQGSEKQLIYALLRRSVPVGALPLDVGVVVSNVSTAAGMARAVVRGKPLTHRVISVTGAGIKTPKNVLAPIGTPAQEILDFCGGLNSDAARVIAGGPMMGFAFGDLATPTIKGTGALTVLTQSELKKAEETSCVRCGRCVDACPMHLVPTKIALASRHKDVDLAQQYNIMACFECGSCAYICPASLPLVQLIRTGKAQVVAASKKS